MIQKKISLLEFENNPNIGLYMFVNDKFCILGKEINEKKKKEIEKILNVPIYHVSILSTELVGVFISGNNEFLIIPELLEYEYLKFKEICEKHSVKLVKLRTEINTIGNNLCVGNNEILISENYNKEIVKKLEKETSLKLKKVENSNFGTIGALSRYIDGKYFISQELDIKMFKFISNKISGMGTINSGSNFISSGVVGNKFGLLIGSNSSTIEIQNIVDAFNEN